MDGLPIFAGLALWGTPFWLAAIFALRRAAAAPGDAQPGRWFRNRPAALGIALPLIAAALVAAAFALFGVLGCDGGLIDPITCRHAPDRLGAALYEAGFRGLLVTELVGLPGLVLCIFAELATRIRGRRHG
ncbi:MAG: hypothetical protein KDK10_15850 [Maritimibacter sp.]|nr:hypothetical protein [Maritimibacter sp.]